MMSHPLPKTLKTVALVLFAFSSRAQTPAVQHKGPKEPAVIGYYAGRNTAIDSFATNKLTHILFSFAHLNGNLLYIANANDSATIRHMVALKTQHPGLKVIISLGGWGGCQTCPLVFATKQGRQDFVRSVKEITAFFHTDG